MSSAEGCTKPPAVSGETLVASVVLAAEGAVPTGGDGVMSDRRSRDDRSLEEVQRLLSRAPIIRSACDLDLLVFFHRHPRVLLTSEQLAAFLGYEMNGIAKAIEAFVEGGVLERTQNPAHAARLYVLTIHGPQGGGLGAILELASTRPGRQQILALLEPSEAAPSAVQEKSSRESINTEVLYARH